ncbi:MAG: hypothetical protein IJ092_10495 [Atopobiaceae bacterium]|nr:hypothetical protein [Atopobiaceae bacterium]
MKKRDALIAAFTFVLALVLAACGASASGGSSSAGGAADTEKGEGVMTYAEYMAAKPDDAVTIEAYVQGKQSWCDNKATIYAADADGAYFIYNATCTEDDYAKLVDGQKIKVTGFKAEWSGEIEVAEGATIEIEDGNYIATAVDVTDKLGTDELINFQNQKVAFKGLSVAPSKDPDGKEVAYLYNWDGSGSEGDDLYFNVTDGTNTYSFTVESYLTDKDSDVYKAVKGLNVGDAVDMEGFLYWYEGANPHITSVTVK